MVKEDSDWLRHGGERPKLSARMYIVGSQSRKIDKLNKYSLLEIENAQLRSYPDM